MANLLTMTIGTPPPEAKKKRGRPRLDPNAPTRGAGLYQKNSAAFFANTDNIKSQISKSLLSLAFGPAYYTAQTRAIVTALGPVAVLAKRFAPKPGGMPRMFSHRLKNDTEMQVGEYGKTGNLAKSIIVVGNPDGAYPGAKIGIDRKFAQKVLRGKQLENSRPPFYSHLVELGFTAKSRVPGIVGRRKIKREDRGERTKPNDLIRFQRQLHNQIKTAQSKFRKLDQKKFLFGQPAAHRDQMEKTSGKLRDLQATLDKAIKGQTTKGKKARKRLTKRKLRRRLNFISRITKQVKTKVPGVFFLRRAWEATETQVAQIYLDRIKKEYVRLMVGLGPSRKVS